MGYMFFLILLIVSFIFLCIGLIFMRKNRYESFLFYPGVFLVIICTLLLISGAFAFVNYSTNGLKESLKKELVNEIKTDMQNGYELYLDGKEVKLENIDLNDYKIKIDNSKKKIILSR